MRRMDELNRDRLMRMAAFEHVRRLSEIHDCLTATELKPGFVFDNERIAFNAGSLTDSIIIATSDYRRVASAEVFRFAG